jgi:hypothetical protein
VVVSRFDRFSFKSPSGTRRKVFLVKIGPGKVFDLLSPSSFIFIHCEQFLGKILPTY